jgi:hypothetical protein
MDRVAQLVISAESARAGIQTTKKQNLDSRVRRNDVKKTQCLHGDGMPWPCWS